MGKSRDFGIRRAIELQVAGAYHSRLMASAEEKLSAALMDIELHGTAFPVICNVEARETNSPGDVRRTLAAQVTGSVRWEESMRLLLSRTPREFVELGPGGVLAGLLRKTDKKATSRTLSGAADFGAMATVEPAGA
jgi:[acyl-carrier-protein] S-malonyltransferase